MTYFADASNEEKQAVMIIVKPMPYSGLSEDGDTVRLFDIRILVALSTCNLSKNASVYQDGTVCVNSFKNNPAIAIQAIRLGHRTA